MRAITLVMVFLVGVAPATAHVHANASATKNATTNTTSNTTEEARAKTTWKMEENTKTTTAAATEEPTKTVTTTEEAKTTTTTTEEAKTTTTTEEAKTTTTTTEEAKTTTTTEEKKTSTETVTTTTVTETTATTTTTTATTTTSTELCFSKDVAWEPHMNNSVRAKVKTPIECQHICATTQGCVHFSLFEPTGECYLQDRFAIQRFTRYGFVSGPFACMDKLSTEEVDEVLHEAKLPSIHMCLEAGVSYEPMLHLPEINLKGSQDEMIEHCQKRCSENPDCAFYTVDFNLKECKQAGKDATPLTGFAGQVSGLLKCSNKGGGMDYLPLDMPFKKFATRGGATVQQAQQRSSPVPLTTLCLASAAAAVGAVGLVVAGVAVVRSKKVKARTCRPLPENDSKYQGLVDDDVENGEASFVE